MSQPHDANSLTTPVQFLKGVGPDRAKVLERLGLRTVTDVLFFFPRDYQDCSQLVPIDQLVEGQLARTWGVIEDIDVRGSVSGRVVFGVLIRQADRYLRAIWFNQPYLQKKFREGMTVVLTGVPQLRGLRWEMVHPQTQILEGSARPVGEILPVYRLTEGIQQHQVRRIVREVVHNYAVCVPEVLPESFREQQQICSIQQAIVQIHTPGSQAQLDQARQRLVYQELLVMQLALALRRVERQQGDRAVPMSRRADIDARIRRLFPFPLTSAQERAIAEIAADMARPVPMNRLLQGDVGSGKTVVAVYAILLAVAYGQQAVFVAPTEVLAQQHFLTLERMLRHSRVRLELLTGSLSGTRRRHLLKRIQEGDVDLVVSTHAVLHAEVQFARLALVVIDEQHKFGVRQRSQLRQGQTDPHYLVMTATPIPRTIAMTLFGDLDVSTLAERPPGHQPVHTYIVDEDRGPRWWEFFRNKLREGRQGYVVLPLIEEGDDEDLTGAEQALEHLANGELAEFRLGLLHGRLSTLEKTGALDQFRQGRTHVLVATSIIEVGIDVPNANLMVIQHAERFGLAQLHQLRGRVARGMFPGYVGVFASAKTEEAQQRLKAFAETTDGFKLAEIDFTLRGPGHLLGTRQHGLPAMRIADLVRDALIVERARCDADQLVRSPEWSSPEFERLRRMVENRYGRVMELGDVG